ncbi:MAG: hypothetical protein IBX55_00420 [Methyloprofundus sp.]|nr:hypothetical protein [Methyloprofundus sp.]
MCELKPLEIGGKYNFIDQNERLVYLGKEGSWNQFALVEKPFEIWAEVLDTDLYMIEESK